MQHAKKNGLLNQPHKRHFPHKEYKYVARKKFAQYTKQGKLVKEWLGLKIIEKELGFKYTPIVNCCRNRIKTAYGYVWRYI